MNNTQWVLLDTETTGFSDPIFVVELAAQRMRGWTSDGEPFRKLLNQNRDIPGEASRVHGYTREILERDGESAHLVYQEFADYVGNLPLVAFNLQYDLDTVLVPEWKRLGISPIGSRGLCALRLAQRLLDPVPAGNCKLQTLRQYYRLPERGAHTALGDVQTVVDLLAHVLRPIADSHGLMTWQSLTDYSTEEWFPSRIAFGKHKGRLILEASEDVDLRDWLDWLTRSSNPRNARMGQWYLRQLEMASPLPDTMVYVASESESESKQSTSPRSGQTGLVIYINPELEQLRQLVACGRARLADLEECFTKEKSRVDAVQATLFRQLRVHYQKRDRVRLIVDYRRKFLNVLVRSGDNEAKQEESHYEQAKSQSEKDYEETAASVADKTNLTPEQEAELSRLWKKLVKLYHPDRFANQPDKLETYDRLTTAINQAKDSGDIETLRKIADDPQGFIISQGWTIVDFSDAAELSQLRRLHELLQLDIIAVLESLNRLRESSDYELSQLVEKRPGLLDELVLERKKRLDAETAKLEKESAQLAQEIEELTGEAPERII
jgi:DNA polymerase III epsilon subunit-like protein